MPGAPDSMKDGLAKILGSLGQLMVAPDADHQFLSGLQQSIVTHLQRSSAQTAQMGAAGGPGAAGGLGGGMGGAPPTNAAGPPPPGPMGAGMGMGGGVPASMGPGGGAGMVGLNPMATNADELRRMLSGAGGPGGAS